MRGEMRMTQMKSRWAIILTVLTAFGLIVGFNPISATAYPFVSISEIQGDGFSSLYKNQYVETRGIVTADFQSKSKRGYFIQDPVGDGNPATSDGILVYDRYDYVSVGDEVLIGGKVSEYYGLTEIYYTSYYTVLSTGNPLPEPVELNPPFDDYASDVYYEALEGMLVSVSDLKVVAATDGYGEIAGVVEDLDIDRVFRDDPAGTGELIFTDDAGGYKVIAKTGDLVKGLHGPLDYTYDEYKILPSSNEPPTVIEKGSDLKIRPKQGRKGGISIATYNMYNLFDEFDDPEKDDTVYSSSKVNRLLSKHAHTIKEILQEPDLIAVQEVENIEILERQATTSPIEAEYGAVLIEGPYYRAVDVGLLYRKDKVTILSAEARQTCTTLDDEYGPGYDPNFPCPPGTNPLFSRPPLIVHLEIKGDGSRLWLIINHFKSKSIYGPSYADTTPRRIEQAAWVGNLVDEIQDSHPEAPVIVLGDLNDFVDSEPIQVLVDGGLRDLILDVEKEDRYTYIYRGASQVLDHIMITPSLEGAYDDMEVQHFNVDYPYPSYAYDANTGIRSSDHEVLIATFDLE